MDTQGTRKGAGSPQAMDAREIEEAQASGGIAVLLDATLEPSILKETCSVAVFNPSEVTVYDADVDDWVPGGIEGALNWLRKDAGGKLGTTSKAAWVQACKNWERLKGEDVEKV